MGSFSLDETKEAYQNLFMEATQNSVTNLTSYQDGKIAERLVSQGHDDEFIKAAIAELSPIANEQGKFPIGYASHLVESSKEVLAAIAFIKSTNNQIDEALAADNIVDSIKRLSEISQNHPGVMAYIVEAQNQMTANPDIKLNAAFDTGISYKLLKNGHPVDSIKEAIELASPIAKEPGRNPINYAKYIVTKIEEKLDRLHEFQAKIDNEYDQTAEAYIKKIQSVQEANPSRVLNNYWDGQISLDLVRSGHEPENIRRVLREISPVAQKLSQEKNVLPEKYANRIVYQFQNVLQREDAARFIEPKDDLAKLGSPIEEYKHHLKTYLDGETIPNNFIDTQISKAMLQDKYIAEDIQKAILEASPVAVEPGRTAEHYSQKIIEQAVEQLERQYQITAEREVLKTIESAPRIEDLGNAPKTEDLYNAYAKVAISESHDKWSPELDSAIAVNMLKAGIKSSRVESALKYSPSLVRKVDTEKVKAARTIVNQVKKNEPELSRGKSRAL